MANIVDSALAFMNKRRLGDDDDDQETSGPEQRNTHRKTSKNSDISNKEEHLIAKVIHSDLCDDDLDVVEEALVQLADMCFPSTAPLDAQKSGSDASPPPPYQQHENRMKIVNEAGHMAVISVMDNNADDMVIQARGCIALGSLAWNCPCNQIAIAEAGGIQSVVGAMQDFAASAAVQRYATGALLSLIHGNEPNKLRLAKVKGGTQAVLSAMPAAKQWVRATIKELGTVQSAAVQDMFVEESTMGVLQHSGPEKGGSKKKNQDSGSTSAMHKTTVCNALAHLYLSSPSASLSTARSA